MTENRALKNAIRERMGATGEKYTEARRAVLDDAVTGANAPLHVQEAQRLGHGYIGSEHLLLGILADEEGISGRTLAAQGVTLEIVRRRVEEICGLGEEEDASSGLSYTPRATVVRRLAEIEAECLGELLPREAHLVLAILTEGEGVPSRIFRDLDVDLSRLRQDLLEALEVPSDLREAYLRQRTAIERARRSRRRATLDGG